jgi:hypothetical protein
LADVPIGVALRRLLRQFFASSVLMFALSNIVSIHPACRQARVPPAIGGCKLRGYWTGTSTICGAGAPALPCCSLLGVNIRTSLDSCAGLTKMMCGASSVPVSTDRPDRQVGTAGPATLWSGALGGVASTFGIPASPVSPGIPT